MEVCTRLLGWRASALRLAPPSRALAAVAKERTRGTGASAGKGGTKGGGKGGKFKSKKEADAPLSREQTAYLGVLRTALYGDGKAVVVERTAAELAEMQAATKEYARNCLREERARVQRLGELIRLRRAAVAALPPALRAEAETPFEQLPWYEQAFPFDVLKPTETPPIDGFAAKVEAAEAAILEEQASAQRAAEAERKRRATAQRAGEEVAGGAPGGAS